MKLLFLDERKIAYTRNAVLKLGKVEKDSRNPLFGEEYFAFPPKAWEVRYDNGYASVLFDEEDGLYKCWYTLFIRDSATERTPHSLKSFVKYTDLLDGESREMGVCYAVSEDGVTWRKPALGITEFSGSRDNNIVMQNVHGAGIFKDTHESDPGKRFKMLFKNGESGLDPMAISFSPEGLHWCEPIPWKKFNAAGDCHNNAFWDKKTGTYIGFTRLWKNGQRVVARTESVDFLDWSEPVEVLRGSDRNDQVYSMPVFPYEDLYIGLPSVYHDEETNAKKDEVGCEMAWSPDTVYWHRVCPGRELIPRGAGSYPDGDHDWGCIYAASAPLIGERDILLYYMGSNGLHSQFREGSFNLARLKADRFAGYGPENPERVAVIRTAVIPFHRDELHLNARIEKGGWIRAGILNEKGKVVLGCGPEDCRMEAADGIRYRLTWRGKEFSLSEGIPVSYEFRIHRAELYALG